MSEIRYLNFPIILVNGIFKNKRKCLESILYYSIFKIADISNSNNEEENIDQFSDSAEYLNVNIGNLELAFKSALEINQNIPPNPVMVGLNIKIFWDYYDSEKNDFDIICLLAFLSAKSIIGDKPFCKTTSDYFLSRMNGFQKSIKSRDQLDSKILKYSSEYYMRKIKGALYDSWGLSTTSKHTRGFFISFKLSQEDLTYEALKKKKEFKDKQRKKEQEEAYQKALDRITKELG